MPTLKAILFDVDGVLLDSEAANISFYRELFRQIGDRQPEVEVFTQGKHITVEAMLRQVLPHFTDEQIHDWMRKADGIDAGFSQLRLMPGSSEIIPQLAEHYQLGLVTNRTYAGVQELWKVVAWKKYFSAIAAYEDTRAHKPDSEPIHFVLSALGVQPDEAVFIGDALSDFQAAVGAGVKFLMFGTTPVPAGTPVLKDFLQLPDLLHSLS